MVNIKVYDFRLLSGGERCSIITDLDGGIKYVQIGELNFTVDQVEELYDRVINFDPEEYDGSE